MYFPYWWYRQDCAGARWYYTGPQSLLRTQTHNVQTPARARTEHNGLTSEKVNSGTINSEGTLSEFER